MVLHGLPSGAPRDESAVSEPALAERRRGGEVSFPLKLYDGAWVLSDRRRAAPDAEQPPKQAKKGA
ncbi:hypothetical protein FQZ97_1274060 [compost metagenome]